MRVAYRLHLKECKVQLKIYFFLSQYPNHLLNNWVKKCWTYCIFLKTLITNLESEFPTGTNFYSWYRSIMIFWYNCTFFCSAHTCHPPTPITLRGILLVAWHLCLLVTEFQFISSFYNLILVCLARWTIPTSGYIEKKLLILHNSELTIQGVLWSCPVIKIWRTKEAKN